MIPLAGAMAGLRHTLVSLNVNVDASFWLSRLCDRHASQLEVANVSEGEGWVVGRGGTNWGRAG